MNWIYLKLNHLALHQGGISAKWALEGQAKEGRVFRIAALIVSTGRDDTSKPCQVSHGPLMGQLLLPELAQEHGVLLPSHHVSDQVIIQPHFVYGEKHLTQDYERLAAVHLNKCSMCSLLYFCPRCWHTPGMVFIYRQTPSVRKPESRLRTLSQMKLTNRCRSLTLMMDICSSQAVRQSVTSRSGWN